MLPLLAAAPARAAEIRILMLGDSITAAYGLARGQGLPAQLEAALRAGGRDVTIIDAGVSGDTSAGGRARLDWALADRPQAVIVALGGNDGLRGIEPRATEANLAAILDALAARGVPVMLAGMLAPPNLGADYGRDFAATFTRLSAARPGVSSIPDEQAYSDECAAVEGWSAAGTRSTSTVRMRGTSAAAPQVARRLFNRLSAHAAAPAAPPPATTAPAAPSAAPAAARACRARPAPSSPAPRRGRAPPPR